MKRDPIKWRRLCRFLAEKTGFKCEICHREADWRGLSGAHCIRRSRGIIAAPDKAWNVLIACGICHNHNRYGKTGLPLTTEQALEIAKERNERLGVDPEYDGSVLREMIKR